MNNFHDQKNLWLNKWWSKTLIAFCVIVMVGGAAGARNASPGDLKQQEQHNHQEERAERQEPKETPASPERLYFMYEHMEIGMTEKEIVGVSGEPDADLKSETDVENFGHVRNLVFTHDDWMSEVVVVLHNGKAELIVLNHYTEDGPLITKAKM